MALDKGGIARQIALPTKERQRGALLPQRAVDVDEDDVELELEDEDLVVVDARAARAAPPALPVPPAPPSSALPTLPLPTPLEVSVEFEVPPDSSRGSSSRGSASLVEPPRPRLLTPVDHRVADDVAGECLASIAEVTARHRVPLSITPTTVPPPPRRDEPDPDLFDTAVRIPRAKLPAVTAPPFVRSPAPPRSERVSSVFSRGAEPPTSSAAVAVPASTADFTRENKASVAPVSMSTMPAGTAGATVIVVHKPPRTAWIAAAAVGGALLAVLAMRAVTSFDGSTPAKASANASAPPPPVSTQVVAPPAPEPPSSAAVVRFSEDQAVAIPAQAPAQPASAGASKPATHPVAHVAAAKPAPKVAAPPRMPDGSYGLTRSEPTPAAPVHPTATTTIAAPPPGKRALTPEQQLAEAQLKASMK